MSKKTYHGSCLCGRVRYEADIDLTKGTSKCNCKGCWKRRVWSVPVQPADFRSKGGEEELSDYRPGANKGHGGFCKHCGITPYRFVDAAEWNQGEYVSVYVSSLDDLDPSELVAAPVTYCDGKHDNWWNAPSEIRHL